jgi:DUF917 family protein
MLLRTICPSVREGLVQLDASNMHALSLGCAVLGGGGGGDPALGLAMALLAVQEHGPVPVVDLDALPDDLLVMPCGMVGAPAIADERIWNGNEGQTLRDTVEGLFGVPVGALMCFEIGGANGLLPVTWAARCGLPLVDADGMGRAFSYLEKQAMHLVGVGASPVVLADAGGSTFVVRAAENARAGRLARAAATTLGGVCAGALSCMTGARARVSAISGSVSRAVSLGEAMRSQTLEGRLAGAREQVGALVLMQGRVADVTHGSETGGALDSTTIQGTGTDARRQMRLELQSEFLLAVEDGAVLAATPDLICLLAHETGDPIVIERLRSGQAVVVIAAPASEIWRSDAGLALAGPRAFGYDLEYSPIIAGA